MAIVLRGVGTKVNGTTSVASLPQPSGTATGDVLLAFIVDHATSGNSAAPTGWQYRGGAAGSAGRIQVFSAVVGQNSLSGTSWTFSGLTTRSMGQIIGYYNVDKTGYGGLDVAISGRINASGTTGTTGITTVTDGAMIVAGFCSLANGCTWSAEAVTSPALTEEADSANSTYCSLALADGLKASAGATGNSSATMSTNATNGGVLVALRQLVTGTVAGTVCGGSGGVFGNDNSSPASWDYHNGQYSYTQAFTCPGSGPQTVQSIEIYAKTGGGTPANLRCALYDTSRNLICQWSAEILINGSQQWWGGSQGLTGTPTITGGTQYLLALSGDGSDALFGYTTDGIFHWAAGDYTGGFPSTIPDPGTGPTELPCIRATLTAGGITGNFVGTVGSGSVSGTMAGTLAQISGDLAGAHGVAGSTAGTLGNLTAAATGTVRAEGSLAGTLAQITGAFSGAHGVAGSMAGTLATATGVFSGAHGVSGTEAGILPTLTGDLAGIVRVEGGLAGTLGNLTGSVAGAHGVAGETAGVLPNLTGSIDGKFWPPEVTGETVCILPNLIGDFRGKFWPPESEDVIGTFAGTLPNLTGNLVGTFTELSAKWKFPTLFSDSGFQYGDYDPGQAAAIAIGCLHIYMKTGDERAGTWARRILDDLRINRRDQDYGGYMSDRRYGWLNALVLQTFGLGVNGVPGQSYRFPAITEDKAHFDALISWIMARAGDEKPNVLNSDLIPFTFSEAGDMWSYAPYYLAMGQMGSLEAVVLMLGGALERGKIQGDWEWFNRLLAFMVRDNLVVLSPAQIRTVTAACDQAGAANLVRLRYADYDQDSSKYFEVRDQAAIDNWGEQALDLDFRYGSPVILEDPGMARLLCTRLLQRLAPPLEAAEVETWLEGVRIELGDTVAVSSDFHGWDREEFTVLGKNLDLGRRRVHLKLSRTMDYADSWAVDAAGSAFDAWAIDLDSSWDGHWDSRTYVY